MSLRVAPTGVRLTVPPRTPASQIEAFLVASTEWVDAQCGRLAPAPPGLSHGDRLAYLDTGLELVVRPTDTGRQGVAREGFRLTVTLAPAVPPDALVEAWYRRQARVVIESRAQAAAAALGARVPRIAIRDPRSRWGSCSSTGTLSFSWRLLLAPERVLDYVVAHEACHLVRPDHSATFWDLVAEAFPGHQAERAWLREHGALLHRGPAWRLSPS
jgi:predicted metal-dependent hydrolase